MGISSKDGVRTRMELEQRVSDLETRVNNHDSRLKTVEEGQTELKKYLDRIDIKLDSNQNQLMALLGQALGIKQASVTSEAEVKKVRWTTLGTIVTASLTGGGGITLIALKWLDLL